MSDEHERRLAPDEILRLVRNAEQVLYCAVGVEDELILCNDAFVTHVGLDSAPTGRQLHDFLHPHPAPPEGFARAKPPWTARLNFVSGSGEVTTHLAHVSGDGEVGLVVCEPATLSFGNVLDELTSLQAELREANHKLRRKIRELETARQQIKVLGGLIPICAQCKKIRNDRGYWQQLEEFISEHSEAEFSHGLCQECIDALYPDEE